MTQILNNKPKKNQNSLGHSYLLFEILSAFGKVFGI